MKNFEIFNKSCFYITYWVNYNYHNKPRVNFKKIKLIGNITYYRITNSFKKNKSNKITTKTIGMPF